MISLRPHHLSTFADYYLRDFSESYSWGFFQSKIRLISKRNQKIVSSSGYELRSRLHNPNPRIILAVYKTLE